MVHSLMLDPMEVTCKQLILGNHFTCWSNALMMM